MKRLISLTLCIITLFSIGMLVGCDKKGEPGVSATPAAEPTIALPDTITVKMQIKNYGTLEIELYPKLAPQTVANFIYLAKNHYYNGVVFDYIEKDFIAQAGSYSAGYAPKTTEFDYTIKGEFTENGFKNSYMFGKGTLAMALDHAAADPANSAHTNFFICLSENVASLDGKYAAFGQVKSGMEVFDEIQKLEQSSDKRPMSPVEILQVLIESDVSMIPEPEFIRKAA